MKWLDKIANRMGFVKRSDLRLARRNYGGAGLTRFTADWLATSTSADTELKSGIRSLRDRTRQLERDDDYMRSYFGLLHRNVLGSSGISLQMKIVSDLTGKPDKLANDAIENAWAKWGRKENCSANRVMSWRDVCRLVLRSLKRDGGVLVRKVKPFRNVFEYALQPIEIDHLDMELNRSGPGANEIRLGIELDEWHAPIAYHIWTSHPGDIQGINQGRVRRERVTAEDMLHLFVPDRLSQVIGAPAPSATIQRLKMLAGYEEAELIAAREAACKGYGIKQATPEGYQGQADSQGRQLENVEPGMGLLLEPGEEFFGIDPQHPVEAFPAFTKSILRAVAAGLGVSYTSLANDLEGVNYSSIRAGLLEEREEWKEIQEWFIEQFITPVFEDWLAWSLLRGYIKMPNGSALPFRKFDAFNKPQWQGRRWPWVDPLKDVEADIKAIGARLKSRKQIITEDGGDMESIDEEFQNDPVTKDIDSDSVYAPNAKPDPATVPVNDPAQPEGDAVPVKNGNGRLTLEGLVNGKDH